MNLQTFVVVIFMNLQLSITVHDRFVMVNAGPTSIQGPIPDDILEMAVTKLGIKNVKIIPDLNQLRELLGTATRDDTLNTIRQLLSTDTGISLMKAFLEDYTDDLETTTPKPTTPPVQIEVEESRPSLPTSLLSETVQKDLQIIRKVITTPKPQLGFFARVSSYLSYFDLFPENKEIPIAPVNKEVQELDSESSEEEFFPRIRYINHEPRRQRSFEEQILSTPVDISDPYGFNNIPMPGGFKPLRAVIVNGRSYIIREPLPTRRPKISTHHDPN